MSSSWSTKKNLNFIFSKEEVLTRSEIIMKDLEVLLKQGEMSKKTLCDLVKSIPQHWNVTEHDKEKLLKKISESSYHPRPQKNKLQFSACF